MILEITNVRRFHRQDIDAYVVTGKVGDRERNAVVVGEDVDSRLQALGAKRSRSEYELRDLAPVIAHLATHDLSEALHR